jgi:hypothetical protein
MTGAKRIGSNHLPFDRAESSIALQSLRDEAAECF